MISAVVLVNTDLGAEAEVLEKVKNVDGVEEAHTLRGAYDLMVNVRANSIDGLKEIISSRLRGVTGVNTTLTLMLVDNPLSHHLP